MQENFSRNRFTSPRSLRRIVLVVAFWLASGLLPVGAFGAVMIWPLDPVIEGDQTGVALWVENRGTQGQTMQLRVLSWTQEAGRNVYMPQSTLVGTPAMFRIEPGKRQLIRLTRTQMPASAREVAYRLLIDEVPDQASVASAQTSAVSAPAAGLRFQVRYSIPLFSYGAGLASSKNSGANAPQLVWRQGTDDGRRWIEVRNLGQTHAKLAAISVRDSNGKTLDAENGKLGYVLAGSYVRWQLPVKAAAPVAVLSSVDGGEVRQLGVETP